MNDAHGWLKPDLLEGITEGVFVLDRELRYVFVNQAAVRVIERPASDLLGRSVWDAFPTAKGSPFVPTFEQALETGRPTVYRGYAPTRDRWFEQRCYPYGEGITVLLLDITEQVRTDAALAASEERFHTLSDTAPVLIWMADLSKGYYYFNRPWLDFTGRTLEQEADNGWAEGVHPDDFARRLEIYTTSFDARRPFEMEYRLRRHDGAYRWLLDRGTPQHDASGAFAGFIGSCIDIHERWSAERQMAQLADASRLLSSTLDYEAVLRQIAGLVVPTLADWCGVQAITEDGRIERVATTHVNPEMVAWANELDRRFPATLDEPGALQHLVRTGESVLMSDVTDEMIVASARGEEHLDVLRKLGISSALMVPLRTRTRIVGVITLITTHGSRRYEPADLRFAEELAARAGAAADNAVLYQQAREAEAALREVNEALEARVEARTAELARSNHELAVRNRELQDFAYVASHDLQEPLRKIRTFADLLMVDFAPDLSGEARAYIGRLQDSAARMSTLIRDLLAFSRVTTLEGTLAPVDLGESLEAALSDLEVRLAETGGRVEVDGALPTVRGDAVQMRQMMLNLVGNALKFHREGVAPLVRVSGSSESGEVRVVVEDNGIGFDERHAERIFTPFQRLHGRGEYEGTGMGLAIVRRIAERYGGIVTATSTPGEGSRFEVVLRER